MNYNVSENVPLVWGVGDVILDRYEVKQIFTSGGMGLGYRVHHRHWGIDLAAKSPRPEFFQSKQQIENFERNQAACETLTRELAKCGCGILSPEFLNSLIKSRFSHLL